MLNVIQEPEARVGLAEIRAALDKIDFLSHIQGSKRDKFLGRLINESFLRTYDEGEVVIMQGDHGHTMFVLIAGAVNVSAVVDGEERPLAQLRADPSNTVWFGEGVVLGRTPRSATVTALGSATLLEIEKVRLEKLDNLAAGVIAGIEKAAETRTISGFLSQHRAFSALNPHERTALLGAARICSAQRGDTIFDQGAPAMSVLLIKTGVAKLSRPGEVNEKAIAYFSSGDVVGATDGQYRAGELKAMGFVECIEIARGPFDGVKNAADARIDLRSSADQAPVKWSDQLNKAVIAQQKKIIAAMSSKTGMMFVEEFMQEGAQIAQSLLTIDLDLCIRCGACVVACESRHGHAKMTRRGKKLVRRRDVDVAGVHQPLLLPSSCRHCDSPECMVGCPTGAIHRKPTGEVAIHDFCIGCSNCALRCPWDNITMVATPGRWVLDRVTGKEVATPKIASKCDLCAGYDEANCVANCPTQAILRVEPTYFPEVREAIGELRSGDDGRTRAEATADRSRWVIGAIAALIAAGMIALYALTPGYSAFRPAGLALGGAALFFMFASAALALRRRLRRLPFKPPHPDQAASEPRANLAQLGRYALWARAHTFIGALAGLGALLHSGFRFGGIVTSLLMGLMFLLVLTGILGVLFYRWLPRAITRIERDAQVQEDVEAERDKLHRRREEMLAENGEALAPLAKKLKGVAGSIGGALVAGYDASRAEGRALEALAPLLDPLGRAERVIAQRLARDAVRLVEIRALLWLYRLRRGFLATHITITATLVTLVLVHVATVAFFYLRIS